MPDRDSPLPQFVIRLRILVSRVFPNHSELMDIGWYKFRDGFEANNAKSPLDLARSAFIDLMLSPEVDADRNDYPNRIGTCLLAYLRDQYGRMASREQAYDLARRWALYKSGATKTTGSIRAWFDEVYGNEPWPKPPKQSNMF